MQNVITHIHSKTALQGVQQNLREGDFVFVRVLKNLGGNNFLASFGGGRFTVFSKENLFAGQTFRAQISLRGGSLVLTPVNAEKGGGSLQSVVVSQFDSLGPEISAFLSSAGLAADSVSADMLRFLTQSGAKINTGLMRKVRSLSKKYSGRESEAAEAALALEEKGIDSESALDTIMGILDGYGSHNPDGSNCPHGNNGSRDGDSKEAATKPFDGERVLEIKKELKRFFASFYGEGGDSRSDNEGILSLFNHRNSAGTEIPFKSWVIIPFEFDANSIAGTGVIRLFLNLEKKIAEKLVITFKINGKFLVFALYFKCKKVVKLAFASDSQSLSGREETETMRALGKMLGENVEVTEIPYEEFSLFGTQDLPLFGVDGVV